jgi:CRISPR-associated DxTHG motif protein
MAIGLSFLGTGNYQKTTYQFKDHSIRTKLFPKALYELFELDELRVIMTKEARKKYEEELTKEIDFQRMDIPSGKDEEEIWKIFECMVNAVPEDAHLIADITHGFRSQPLLMLSALIFLRLYKNVEIDGIYYGAFDAKDDQNISPVFDLTPFLEIIDWTFAIRRFNEKGDAGELSEIMKKVHTQTYTENVEYHAKGLKDLGIYLNDLMKALSAIRPEEVMKKAHSISDKIAFAQQDLAQMVQTKPLALMMNRINDRTEYFLTEKDKDLFSDSGFEVQVAMLKHYLQMNQHQQALTLSVEMLISWACIKHQKDPIDKEDRDTISKRIYAISRKGKTSNNIHKWEKRMNEILNDASSYRNDINHAGMRKDPKSASNIIEKTEEIVDDTIRFIEQRL